MQQRRTKALNRLGQEVVVGIRHAKIFLTVPLFLLALAMVPGGLRAEWVPFNLEHGHIVIDIELAGQPARAMLDSGSELNAIDRRFVEKYGEEMRRSGHVQLRGVNSVERVPLYSNIPLTLYGAELMLNKVPAVSLGRIELMIGQGFFRSFVVQIDYPESRLRFLDRKAVNLSDGANVPMKRAGESMLPAVQVLIQGNPVWLLFDTGNTGGIILRRSFALNRDILDDSTESKQGIATGINRAAAYEHFRLDSVSVGPYELENVKVAVPAEGESVRFGMNTYTDTGSHLRRGVKTEGLIGYDVLKHFLVTVDYDKYKLHLYAP